MMITRKVQETVELSLKQYPVVGILGPRQVGKTTLARAIQSILTQKFLPKVIISSPAYARHNRRGVSASVLMPGVRFHLYRHFFGDQF